MPEFDGDIKLSVTLKPGDVKKSSRELRREIENVFTRTSGVTDKNLQKLQVQMDKTTVKAKTLEKKVD